MTANRHTSAGAWLAVAAIAAVVSCLNGSMAPREQVLQPVPTAKGPPPPLTDDPSAHLDQLYDDLVTRRQTLSLPSTPPAPAETCSPVCTIEDPPDKPSRTSGCAPGSGAACVSTCTQADAVCDDAAQICAIAKELRTDETAAGRCRNARVTCVAAHVPCCECKTP